MKVVRWSFIVLMLSALVGGVVFALIEAHKRARLREVLSALREAEAGQTFLPDSEGEAEARLRAAASARAAFALAMTEWRAAPRRMEEVMNAPLDMEFGEPVRDSTKALLTTFWNDNPELRQSLQAATEHVPAFCMSDLDSAATGSRPVLTFVIGDLLEGLVIKVESDATPDEAAETIQRLLTFGNGFVSLAHPEAPCLGCYVSYQSAKASLESLLGRHSLNPQSCRALQSAFRQTRNAGLPRAFLRSYANYLVRTDGACPYWQNQSTTLRDMLRRVSRSSHTFDFAREGAELHEALQMDAKRLRVRQQSILRGCTTGVHDNMVRSALTTAAMAEAALSVSEVALALERYRLRNDRWPATLEELVPIYIPDIPTDPYDDELLRYERGTFGVAIYSGFVPDQRPVVLPPFSSPAMSVYEPWAFRLLEPDQRGTTEPKARVRQGEQ